MNRFRKNLIRIGAIGLSAAMMFSTIAYADETQGAGVADYSFDTEDFSENDDVTGGAGVAAWDFSDLDNASLSQEAVAAEIRNQHAEADSSVRSDVDFTEEEEHASVLALEKRLRKYDSLYKNVVFPDLEDSGSYINIRSKATADSELVGKLYAKSAAKVLETVDGEDGPWFKIKSGSVTGYVKAYFFITGSTAEEMAKNYGSLVAVINTESLRLRKDASVESEQVAMLSEDDRYPVIGEEGAFIKLQVDDDLTGYVLDDYVTLKVSYTYAISVEEEREAERREKEREEEAERARRQRQRDEDDDNDGGGGGGDGGTLFRAPGFPVLRGDAGRRHRETPRRSGPCS